jgi:hypothetical protein
LKAVDEDPSYERNIVFLKKSYPFGYNLQFLQENLFVVPAPFVIEKCYRIAKNCLSIGNGYVAIKPKFTKLITALRTAVEKGDGTLVRWIKKQLHMMTCLMHSVIA